MLLISVIDILICSKGLWLMFFFFFLKVLSLKETLAAYQSVYFVGTIVPIIFILLGYVIKPARPARSQTENPIRQEGSLVFVVALTEEVNVATSGYGIFTLIQSWSRIFVFMNAALFLHLSSCVSLRHLASET